MSHCSTSATMSKYSVSPSGDRTFILVFLQRIFIAATVSLGMPYASIIKENEMPNNTWTLPEN